jgi:Type IV secretion system pilin
MEHTLIVSTLADASASVGQISNFIKSIIQALAGLSGLVATGYFVIGGFSYITSSGNPQKLEKAKRTITYSGIGLAITIGAFVLSDIVGSLASKAFGV